MRFTCICRVGVKLNAVADAALYQPVLHYHNWDDYEYAKKKFETTLTTGLFYLRYTPTTLIL